MKQALVLVWLSTVSEPTMRFKTCMILMAAAWSFGGRYELLGDDEARRMFVALQHDKPGAQRLKKTGRTIEMRPTEGPYSETCTKIERPKGQLNGQSESVTPCIARNEHTCVLVRGAPSRGEQRVSRYLWQEKRAQREQPLEADGVEWIP